MLNFVSVTEPDQLDGYSTDGLSTIAPELLKQHQPDAHWMLVDNDRLLGRCSLWWRQVPPDPTQRLGLVGHYGAIDADAATLLLDHACEQLAANACTLAVAPIDGSTWRRYRAVCELGSEPLFFLEPENSPEWCSQFAAARFEPIAHYESALNTDLAQHDPRLAAVEARLQVNIRSLNLDRLDAELAAVHQLSLTSFKHNFLYMPIDLAEFRAQYGAIVPSLRPELVLMAERDGQLVGFLFALPDVLEARRKQAIETVIIKTVAVLPGRSFAGLGSVLVARCQAIARTLGYRRVIHALMHETNRSRNLSRRYAQPLRHYVLFGRSLETEPLMR